MDPVHDREIHIVVDLFDQVPVNDNNGLGRHGVPGQASTSNRRRLGFDLNGPAQDVEYPVADVKDDASVDAPTEDFTGSNFEATFDGHIDWSRGSIDVAPDGRLAYYESAPMTVPEGNHGNRGFDLNSAVQEAQDQDEAFYQGRLESLRTGEDFQMEDFNFDFDTAMDEEQHVPLWFH